MLSSKQGWTCAVVGVCLIVAITISSDVAAEPDKKNGYVPVTPPTILLSALESNLDLARQWLKEKDFKSAAQTARGLEALAQLCEAHDAGAAWRKSVSALRRNVSQLRSSATEKDSAGCQSALAESARRIGQLKNVATGKLKRVALAQRLTAETKTWMRLMDGAYSDGKFAETPEAFRNYVLSIAEEANAVSYLRSNERWTKMAGELRDEALAAAKTIHAKASLTMRRAALQQINKRCLACHKTFRP